MRPADRVGGVCFSHFGRFGHPHLVRFSYATDQSFHGSAWLSVKSWFWTLPVIGMDNAMHWQARITTLPIPDGAIAINQPLATFYLGSYCVSEAPRHGDTGELYGVEGIVTTTRLFGVSRRSCPERGEDAFDYAVPFPATVSLVEVREVMVRAIADHEARSKFSRVG